jgi:hypothetical protein
VFYPLTKSARRLCVVDEKKRSGIDNFEPSVSIKTKKLDGIIEVSVNDDGNGIPQK